MKIGDREIGAGQPTYVIAEAGTNHRGGADPKTLKPTGAGSVWRACYLAENAARIGADAIKFQAFVKDAPLFCPLEGDEERIPYWNGTSLTTEEWSEVAECAHKYDIHFILSVFQAEALSFLRFCDAAKVASRAAATFPYDKTDLPLIISDGFIDSPADIDGRLQTRERAWLHCVPKYPTPLSEARFPLHGWSHVARGISDHSGTPWPAIDAISHGADLVEVHFHLDSQPSRDLAVELGGRELIMVCNFRDAMAQMA